MSLHFNILKCQPISELFDIMDLREDKEYFISSTPNGIEYYRLILDTVDAAAVYESLKDIDIYVPHIGIYLSDYLLLKKTPTKEIMNLLNYFSMDDFIQPFLNTPKIIRFRREYNKLNK